MLIILRSQRVKIIQAGHVLTTKYDASKAKEKKERK